MFDNADLLPISALQHLLFCPRQCALMYLERLWAENRFTVEGRRLHKRAHGDDAGPGKSTDSTRDGVRTTRAVQLASYRLGLFGVADVIEWPVAPAPGAPGAAAPAPAAGYPLIIEYKRGRPKKHDADRVQLCAQALCLEEMLDAPGSLAMGAIFYGRTRRRLDVPFDPHLRARTGQAAAQLHDLIGSGITPSARREPKCDKCSLLHLCLPDALRPRKTAAAYLQQATAQALRET